VRSGIYDYYAENAAVHITATVGSRPFSYIRRTGERPVAKVPAARVTLGDRVELFAHANIDQGIERNTAIGDDVKIAQFAHVGHDTIIGARTVICPHAFIAGHVDVGVDCYIGANASVMQRVSIGDGAKVGIGAVVICDVPAGATVSGNPARVVSR
jgi:UDP-3-O-[3-hydroxymyristoyl] glucosamine N-acyltransferase